MVYSSPLKMEVACSSETSVEFQWTVWHYIPEDRALYMRFNYIVIMRQNNIVNPRKHLVVSNTIAGNGKFKHNKFGECLVSFPSEYFSFHLTSRSAKIKEVHSPLDLY
jgi:hypothetical protein